MEQFKRFEEIMQADIRQSFFCVITPHGSRPYELKDFYEQAKGIELHNGVPEVVRYHFLIAKHLLIYSWFVYPFNVTAELHGYIAVEAALRIKSGQQKWMLSKLMKEAVLKGWIRDEQFAVVQRQRKQLEEHEKELAGMGFNVPPRPNSQRKYVEILQETVPMQRNTYAHGEKCLHNRGAGGVRLCAEIINQLFDPKQVENTI